ncbi:hypothetical protein FOZ62_008301 [Perkinsus olseni]|uniref:Uncharacterized protein n=2 Tax=Perkinsus olseni TaxID=32597 RepID=A0A7J6RCR9_PEROL|nr:hypothetical protein FOZ62_008301 [Perkinsus olseni]
MSAEVVSGMAVLESDRVGVDDADGGLKEVQLTAAAAAVALTTPNNDKALVQEEEPLAKTPEKVNVISSSGSPGESSTHVDTPSPSANTDAEPAASVHGDAQDGSILEHASHHAAETGEKEGDEDDEPSTEEKVEASEILPAIPLDNSAAANEESGEDKWHGSNDWNGDEESGWKRGRSSKWERGRGGGWKSRGDNGEKGWKNWKDDGKKWKQDENGRWVEIKDDKPWREEDGDNKKEEDKTTGKWGENDWKNKSKREWGGTAWKGTMGKDDGDAAVAEEENKETKETKEEREKRRQEEAAKFADPEVVAGLEKEYAMTLSKVVDEKRKFQEKFEQLSRVIQAAEVRQKDMNLAGHNLIHQLKAALEDFDKADQGQEGAMDEAVKTIPGSGTQDDGANAPSGFEWRHVEKVGISSRGPPLPSQDEIYAQAVNFGQVHSYSDRWGGNTNTAWRNSSDNSSWNNNNNSWSKDGGGGGGRGSSYDNRQRGGSGGRSSWRGGGGYDRSRQGGRSSQWD